MDKKQKNVQDNDTINLWFLAKALWRRAWAILLITVIVGASVFGFTKLFVKPKYSSSVMLYVNNGDLSLGGVSISASQLSAAQSLVDTYMAILDNRTTLEEVRVKAGVKGDWKDIKSMIAAEPVNGTEIFKVTVTTEDADKSAKIANSVAEVLSIRVETIIDGCSVKVVDSAVPNKDPVAPSATKNAIVGMLFGFVAACVLFAILARLDDTIRSEDFITETYNLPILAKIPNLMFESRADYYYKKNARYKSVSSYSKAVEAQKTESEEAK